MPFDNHLLARLATVCITQAWRIKYGVVLSRPPISYQKINPPRVKTPKNPISNLEKKGKMGAVSFYRKVKQSNLLSLRNSFNYNTAFASVLSLYGKWLSVYR